MVTHAIKKLDFSKWQSIEKVSLLQFCETTIKVLTPSALFRITVMRKKSPLLWLFSFFLFLTYSLLCTLKTHYRLTFSASQANTYENRNLIPQTRLQTAILRRDEIPIHSDQIQFSWRHLGFIYETFPCISDNPMIRWKTSHSYIKPNFTLYCFTLHSNYSFPIHSMIYQAYSRFIPTTFFLNQKFI